MEKTTVEQAVKESLKTSGLTAEQAKSVLATYVMMVNDKKETVKMLGEKFNNNLFLKVWLMIKEVARAMFGTEFAAVAA